MDGIHDLGGKHGFGTINRGEPKQSFAERWHAAVFTIVNTLMRRRVAKNIDHFRHSVERIDPISYLTDGYYGRWLGAAETLLVEAGEISQQEINLRVEALGGQLGRIAARPMLEPDTFAERSERIPDARRDLQNQPNFKVGQLVVTNKIGVVGHTRLPAYARNATGKIVAHHGGWVFPDSHAHGRGTQAQHLYTVAFSAHTMWGDEAESEVEICVDLFESYLRAVEV